MARSAPANPGAARAAGADHRRHQRLQAVNFLTRGAGRPGRWRGSYDRRGGGAGGGRVAGRPRLLLTNTHVLPVVATAEQAAAEFNWESTWTTSPGRPPHTAWTPALFLPRTSRLHAFAVQAGPDGRTPARSRWNRLIAQQARSPWASRSTWSPPDGAAEEIAIRNNSSRPSWTSSPLQDRHRAGQLGSPVFNDQWRSSPAPIGRAPHD